jgi:aminoglycoside phosphotransferase (APT) family kinase protein
VEPGRAHELGKQPRVSPPTRSDRTAVTGGSLSNPRHAPADVVKRWGVSLTETLDLLTKLGLEPCGSLQMAPLGNGRSNITLRVTDDDGQSWVIRRPPLGATLHSAHDMERESRLLSALQVTDVPTPAFFGAGAALDGATLLVIEWIDGRVIDGTAAAKSLSVVARRQVGVSMAEALARLHSVEPDAIGLGNLASRRPYAERQLDRWTRQWEASRTRDLPEIERLAERLRAAIPPERERTIVHGDLSINNVILDPSQGHLRAVLDWELSTLGDPLADAGTLLAYWTAPSGELGPAATTLSGFLTGDELLQAYSEASGRDIQSVSFWYVLALWKLAIIGEGVRRRALTDPRNAARTGVPGAELVETLIELAAGAAEATL